jgi:hypothetical protein
MRCKSVASRYEHFPWYLRLSLGDSSSNQRSPIISLNVSFTLLSPSPGQSIYPVGRFTIRRSILHHEGRIGGKNGGDFRRKFSISPSPRHHHFGDFSPSSRHHPSGASSSETDYTLSPTRHCCLFDNQGIHQRAENSAAGIPGYAPVSRREKLLHDRKGRRRMAPNSFGLAGSRPLRFSH